ncbi:replicative helicase loader/inhibitor [Paenibacillus psychroresistens]|uniref:replicative helicase loader/inhibitor n=1 Tax=Paenibacillus psychroresistens TaxID=1778678 RepID=UPI0013907703|nr:replicative helicase loader/inhibitor [Paenibacillus psychroresistens]
MNKVEVKQLFLIINNCYPNFQYDDIKTEIWTDMLKGVSFETGQRNLRDHIAASRYSPTISDIVQQTSKEDREILLRNADLAFEQYVNEGGDPYKYVPGDGSGYKKLGG